MSDFAVFILSHGRPDRVITYDTIRREGYTGPIYLIIDSGDETKDQYINKYGDQLNGLFGMTSVATPNSADAVTQAGKRALRPESRSPESVLRGKPPFRPRF